MKQSKKVLSITLCAALITGMAAIPGKASAAKIKLSATSATLTAGKTKTLKLKKGSTNLTNKAKWKTSNKKVATVSKGKIKAVKAGKATITATYKKKNYKCKVTVKAVTKKPETTQAPAATTAPQAEVTQAPAASAPAVSASPAVSSAPVVSSTPAASLAPEVSAAPAGSSAAPSTDTTEDDFNFETDCTVTYGKKDVNIEFVINKEDVTEEELEAEGYTVEDGKAKKRVECDTATYSFTKLPNTLSEIQQIPLQQPEGSTDPDAGFGAMAGTICAMATFDLETYNRRDKIDKTCPMVQILDYLNGPNCEFDNYDLQHLQDVVSNKNLVGNQLCFFDGASTTNGYTPTEPYTFTIYEGPYYIKEKTEVTGKKRPETHMILIQFAGDDSQRYIDVYKSKKDGNWYSWDDQWKHMSASFKPLEEEY